jgi:NADPH:quinone reductase-like Zn-dependent oxidoreductase
MLAAYAKGMSREDPLSGLEVGEIDPPETPGDWTTVTVRACALNRHDVWSLLGVGLREEQLPMILGCDAAGLDEEGNEVIVHAVIPTPDWRGDETLDPKRTLLSELHPGTLAEQVRVPRGNLVPKPEALSFEEAACLPTAWLTAYRMLFTRADLRPGMSVLVQGAGGGLATAAIELGAAAGLRVYATSRDAAKREAAEELGARAAFEHGERLPERVDAVIETVGKATWSHSLRSLRSGGKLVVAGATSGDPDAAEITRVFFMQLQVLGSMMGTRQELEALANYCADREVRPRISEVIPLADARKGFELMLAGELIGKVVFTT